MKVDCATSPKGLARRESIVAKARQVLLKEGYPGLSLRSIASQLGISVGNLQYYFPTKDDLVEAVLVGETRKPIDILDRVVWNPDDIDQSVYQAVEPLLRYYASEAGGFYGIMESLALYDPRYNRLKAKGYAYVLTHVEKLIARMAPHLRVKRRESLAKVLVALIDGASLQLQFSRSNADNAKCDVLIRDVTTAIKQLIKGWN